MQVEKAPTEHADLCTSAVGVRSKEDMSGLQFEVQQWGLQKAATADEQQQQQQLQNLRRHQRSLAVSLMLAIHPPWLSEILPCLKAIGADGGSDSLLSIEIVEKYEAGVKHALDMFSSWQQVLDARLPNRGLVIDALSKWKDPPRPDDAELRPDLSDLSDDEFGTCPSHWAVSPTLEAAYDVTLNVSPDEGLPSWLQVKALSTLRDRLATEGPSGNSDHFDALLRVTDAHDATTLHRACRYGHRDVVAWICGVGDSGEEAATTGESTRGPESIGSGSGSGSSRIKIGVLSLSAYSFLIHHFDYPL